MCDYCRKSPCESRCPNFDYGDSVFTCWGCGEGIYPQEEYIQIGNLFYHKECAYEMTAKEVLSGFGIRSERIED